MLKKGWCSILVEVINLNSDLKRLQDEGYELEVKEGCAIIRNVPYLDSSQKVQKGILVSPLAMSGDRVKYNGVHTIYFQGSVPYRKNGEKLSAIFHSLKDTSYAGVSVNMMFSNKPLGGYKDYYEKFVRYIQILSAEAQAIDSTVTAATFRRVVSSEDSIFCYADTNASRAAIMDVTDKLKGHRIGVVGLGGTGSYLLDQLSKTPVKEIHLFDGDVFCQHNAFRAPGAPTVDVFEVQPFKSDYFKSIYGNMHQNIISHPYNIDESNIENLRDLDFVFLAMDSGNDKQKIVEFLAENKISFIDTGIDITKIGTELIGMTRSTLSKDGDTKVVEKHVSFAETEKDLYQSNVQTAELNAFCALTAILQWKKLLGFYQDCTLLNNCVYSTNDGEFKWD